MIDCQLHKPLKKNLTKVKYHQLIGDGFPTFIANDLKVKIYLNGN